MAESQDQSVAQLKQKIESLQRLVTRHVTVEQQLISAREQLDREVARLRLMQRFQRKALSVGAEHELISLSLETVIEAFEFECSAMLRYDEAAGELVRLGTFNCGDLPDRLPFDPGWLGSGEATIFGPGEGALGAWAGLPLIQLLMCPFFNEAGALAGVVMSGRTAERQSYYDTFEPPVCSPYTVMVQQIGAVWLNYQLNVIVRDRKYSVLFHRSNDGIMLVELDGKIVDTNERCLELFGYTHAEMTAKKVFDLSPPEEAQDAASVFGRLVEVGSARFERCCVTAEGKVFPAEISASLFELEGRDMVHALVRDITDEKRAQRQLILSDRMAALGQLIAGVAHEINTPVGAIRASVGNIEAALEQTLKNLPDLVRSLPESRLVAFQSLLERARVGADPVSSRDARKLKRHLQGLLEEQEVPDADDVADTLMDMGVHDGAEPFVDVLRDADSGALQAAYDLSSLRRNTDNIRTAIERASKVVFALKKFTHDDHEGRMVPADLVDGIETVLTLYANQLKQGVEVVRRFDALPPVRCYPDELNQVWTNLLHNALQAMDNEGRVEIVARVEEADVVVEIIDAGPGIPADVQERIFEPFFTTKAAGEGSGLGLDICRKILDRHSGSIVFESRPGRTVFRATLPTGGVSGG